MTTQHKALRLAAFAAALFAVAGPACADPVHYKVDPTHTFVSFAAPHIQAISYWRGKFDRTQSGSIVLDRAAKTGTVDITIDTTSIDFGFEKLNEHTKTKDFFDVAEYPTATYKGTIQFTGDAPSAVNGQLTIRGVTKPVTLAINSFKCIQDPFIKIERCGADVSAKINRDDFGVSYGVPMTGSGVDLQIQVEGLIDPPPAAK
jgi:polyisoprenoid-binding protein YceI